MYLDYFGFDEPPFSITPDPKFVFLSEKHQESLAHLVYGITRGGGAGFVQLTGEVGTGKTTISRLLLEQIPDKTNVALILNPTITPVELLENICKELKVPLRGIKGKLNNMVDKLNDYLLKSWSAGENTVVIIDEAQNLPRDTLEQLRLLTNLETDKQKLLQIILIGQPELRSTMRRNDLRQLAQRVTARYHLMPLSIEETFEYLQHRIKVAGGNPNIVNNSAAKRVFKLTEGVPRLINILMDRALLSAYSADENNITIQHLNIAATEVLVDRNNSPSFTGQFASKKTWLALMIVTVLAAVFLYKLNHLQKQINNNPKDNILKIPPVESIQSFSQASSEKSWRYFFSLWDTQTDENWHKPRCPNNIDTGMACLRRQGNLKQIEKLNHPVLLQLEDSSLVLLSTIDNGKIGVLNYNNEIEYVDKSWLGSQWLGTYFVIWPMPAEMLLEPNKKQMQAWSLEMANTITETKINSQQLHDWIIEFQQKQGLLADGIIGSETQMALSLNAYNGPTLKK